MSRTSESLGARRQAFAVGRGESDACDLSVVLPCYKGGRYVPDTLRRLGRDLAGAGVSWEIIIVDDGGHDVQLPMDVRWPNVAVIQFPVNQGEGAAVREGMLAAKGHVRAYTDVDLPFGSEPVLSAYTYIKERGFHAVVGDRTLCGSTYARALTLKRRLLSTAFSSFVGHLMTPGYFDTQCGFKALRGDVAQAIYSLSRVDRFAQDVELVYLLLYYRLDVKRIPVRMEAMNPSTLRIARDSSRMLWDLAAIRTRRATGRYGHRWLETLLSSEYYAQLHEAIALYDVYR